MTEVKPPSMQLLHGLEVGAVVQMQGDGDVRALDDGSLDQLHQIGVVGIGARALGNLQDDGSLHLAGRPR